MNFYSNIGFWLYCLTSKTGHKLLVHASILAASLIVLIAMIFASAGNVHAASRLKDIVNIEGVRENALIGYGLVVGLNGTGDKLNNSAFTEKSLVAFLERLGINTRGDDLKTKNVAAVTVTAHLPPFSRAGSRIDVTVSTMGDAKSLQGGVLLATPLMAADGEVYAVAQGALSTEGFSAGGDSGSSISKGVPTAGFLPAGATVEKEVAFDFNSLRKLTLALKNPDVSTAMRLTTAINHKMEDDVAVMRDPGTVEVWVPEEYENSVAMLLAEIEQLTVQPDQVARVVMDEASGTIVIGENVRVDNVAIAQGNLVIRIDESEEVSQPGAFAPEGADTEKTQETTVSVSEDNTNLAVLQTGTTLQELVSGLNSLGVGPRDLISILQTIKASGAMQAELETR